MLASTPQGDGTSIIKVDWPFYVSGKKRMYYQHHDKEGAAEAAHRFAESCQSRRDVLSWKVYEDRQAFIYEGHVKP